MKFGWIIFSLAYSKMQCLTRVKTIVFKFNGVYSPIGVLVVIVVMLVTLVTFMTVTIKVTVVTISSFNFSQKFHIPMLLPT